MHFHNAPFGALIAFLLVAGCRDESITGNRSLRLGAELANAVVPMSPPDSMADWVLSQSSWVTKPARVSVPFVRDLVIVRFAAGATQQQRQNAIDAVDGIVVGGVPFFGGVEGAYYVSIPDDSTNDRVFVAIDTLRTFAHVEDALPDLIVEDEFAYRRANDGSGLQAADWRLSPDSAFGNPTRLTWALEAVNAPFGWGCSTGDSTVRVAVLDGGLRPTGDIVSNVIDTAGMTTGTFTHGIWMASIIGARGHNGASITGMMWRVGLLLYGTERRDTAGNVMLRNGTPFPDVVATAARITQARAQGARIINMSIGVGQPHTGGPTAAQDSARAYVGRLFRNSVVNSSLPRPLLVLATGNVGNATDVYWSHYAAVADYLPNETILATGASATAGALWAGSVTGSAISIAAPAQQVAFDDGTTVRQGDGTSFAAAFVSGAAGLLWSFDPTLTAARVKQLIDSGAIAGGRMAGQYRLLWMCMHLSSSPVGDLEPRSAAIACGAATITRLLLNVAIRPRFSQRYRISIPSQRSMCTTVVVS